MSIQHKESGYSLLEILAALTVLVIGFGALNSLTGAAQNNAILARDLSMVQQVCQTRMNELIAGTVPLRTTMDEPIPDMDDWYLSVTLDPTQRRGVLVVAVSAKRHNAQNQTLRRGGRFRIVHWLNVAEPPRPTAVTPLQSGSSGRGLASSSDSPRAGTLDSLFTNPNRNIDPDFSPQPPMPMPMSSSGMTADLPPLPLPDEPTNLPDFPSAE